MQKDVTITDIGLPQGLVLAGGTQSMEVLGVQQQVNYPYRIRKQDRHMKRDLWILS